MLRIEVTKIVERLGVPKDVVEKQAIRARDLLQVCHLDGVSQLLGLNDLPKASEKENLENTESVEANAEPISVAPEQSFTEPEPEVSVASEEQPSMEENEEVSEEGSKEAFVAETSTDIEEVKEVSADGPIATEASQAEEVSEEVLSKVASEEVSEEVSIAVEEVAIEEQIAEVVEVQEAAIVEAPPKVKLMTPKAKARAREAEMKRVLRENKKVFNEFTRLAKRRKMTYTAYAEHLGFNIKQVQRIKSEKALSFIPKLQSSLAADAESLQK